MMNEAPGTVMVVDDTPETRRLMRRILERDSWQVVEAESGEEALRLVAGSPPAVIVLDLRLPGISGFEVAKAIRHHPNPDIRKAILLACSASVQEEIRAKALDAGCDAFQGKPFDIAFFPERLRELVAHRTRS